MADKCTMFDQYPCDRLIKTQRELDAALQLKEHYRENARTLSAENADLREKLAERDREYKELRQLINDARALFSHLY